MDDYDRICENMKRGISFLNQSIHVHVHFNMSPAENCPSFLASASSYLNVTNEVKRNKKYVRIKIRNSEIYYYYYYFYIKI